MNDIGIGKIIDGEQQRDAIHVAVAPVVAGAPLKPGDHVGIDTHGKATTLAGEKIGIVDPFLPGRVAAESKFWLFLYPNTITQLRHNWEHPAFKNLDEEAQRQWVMEQTHRAFCHNEHMEAVANEVGMTYEQLLAHAKKYDAGGSAICLSFDAPDILYDSERFWREYEKATNTVASGPRDVPFHCSC